MLFLLPHPHFMNASASEGSQVPRMTDFWWTPRPPMPSPKSRDPAQDWGVCAEEAVWEEAGQWVAWWGDVTSLCASWSDSKDNTVCQS